MENKKYIAAALVCGFVIGNAMPIANAGSLLGKVLKGGIISTAVNATAPTINDAVNKVLAQNNMQSTYATKVVPIIAVGDGSRAGAAQVSGPQEQIDQCKAALQIEQTILGVRMVALIPIDKLATSNITRVQGVGVSAQIDVKI